MRNNYELTLKIFDAASATFEMEHMDQELTNDLRLTVLEAVRNRLANEPDVDEHSLAHTVFLAIEQATGNEPLAERMANWVALAIDPDLF